MIKYKAEFYKNNRVTKILFDVTKCNADRKYNYFEITQVIYHHQLITIHSFKEYDYVVLTNRETKETKYYKGQ